MSHRMEDLSEWLIAYASQTLSLAKLKYVQLKKEALNTMFGDKQFLYGHKFTILLDCKPLQKHETYQPGICSYSTLGIDISVYNYNVCYKPQANHAKQTHVPWC